VDAGVIFLEERETEFSSNGSLAVQDIFSKYTFKRNKKYTIYFNKVKLVNSNEVETPGIAIILYSATKLLSQNIPIYLPTWVPDSGFNNA
jgi:hypothetical protein